jgi:6-phosphogluconolactonase (cycloisomerase 2 family)
MMKFRFGFILLAAVTLLAGCSGFWNLPPSTTTTTVTKTTLSSGVFYVLNQTTKQIAAYTISTGTLEQVSGSPYSLSSAPNCIAVAPGGGFLYVGTVSGIYLYSIGSGGALTIGNGGAVISSDVASAMQVSGAWLIDAFLPAAGTVQMNAIPINATTGAYTGTGAPPDQTFNVTNASVSQMVLSPDGTNLFLALGRGGTIVVPFTAVNANPLGSKATVIATVNSNGSALSVAVDPTNRLFYIGETLANSAGDSGGLRVFNYSSLSGALTQASGSPIASGGLSPNAILPIANGDYVYVANGQGTTGSGNVAWFPITASGTAYTIAAGNSISAGIVPMGLAEDSEDNFVLAVSTGGSTASGDPDLEAYTMSSGALTAAIATSTGTDPVGAVAVAALP